MALTLTATGYGLASAQVITGSGGPGSTDWVNPTIKVEVDWTGTGVWVDESTNMLGVTVDRGRAASTDVFSAGTATVVMKNTTGKYGPFNIFSALYPNVVSGRPIRITASFQGVSYPRFQGTISEIQEAATPGYAAVSLSCIDAFEQFRLASIKVALQTSQRTDQVLAAQLTAAGWTGGSTLATGRTISTYVQPTDNLLAGLQHAAQQDVRGVVFIGKDGTVTFQNATYRTTQPVWHVFTSVEREDIAIRQSDLVNSVKVTYQAYSYPAAGTAVSSIYSLPAGTLLPAQYTTVLADFYSTPAAKDVVTPVPETDYTVFDHADGSGLDVANNVWVRQLTDSGTGFTANIYNDLPYPVYFQTFGIRGTGFTQAASPLSVLVPAAAPNVANQQLTVAFDAATDVTIVGAWAQVAAAALRNPHPRPVVTLTGKTAALTHSLLGADLSSRIVLSDLVAPHLVGNAGQFFLERIQETYAPAAPPRMTWNLFDQEQGAL